MDTTRRTIVKAITWQAIGIMTMTVLSYWHTGSVLSALSLAVSTSATGFVIYLLHEKIWNAVTWGRKSAASERSRDTRRDVAARVYDG